MKAHTEHHGDPSGACATDGGVTEPTPEPEATDAGEVIDPDPDPQVTP